MQPSMKMRRASGQKTLGLSALCLALASRANVSRGAEHLSAERKKLRLPPILLNTLTA